MGFVGFIVRIMNSRVSRLFMWDVIKFRRLRVFIGCRKGSVEVRGSLNYGVNILSI